MSRSTFLIVGGAISPFKVTELSEMDKTDALRHDDQ